VRASAIAALPADPHFVSVGGPANTRILLFDSSATRPPVEVVTIDAAPAPTSGPDVRAIAFGASADGRVLVIARRFSEQRTVHYLVRPQTGEVVALLTDLAASFSEPVVSPDGGRYAYARRGDTNSTGIFVADARPGPDPTGRVGSADRRLATAAGGVVSRRRVARAHDLRHRRQSSRRRAAPGWGDDARRR
jgi:Tol biopolymer transport system component